MARKRRWVPKAPDQRRRWVPKVQDGCENLKQQENRNNAEEQGDVFEYQIAPGPALRVRHLSFVSKEVVERKGATLWPSGRLLAHFIALRLSKHLPSLRVIELGCGAAALPGLVAARLGARVVLTDLSDIVALASQNAVINGLDVESRPLTWAAEAPAGWDCEPFNLVLAADVLYDVRGHEALAATMEWTAAVSAPVIIATQGSRQTLSKHQGGTDADDFFEMALPKYSWSSCRLDIEDVFDAMGSNDTFRSNFDLWLCWRSADRKPLWCGPAAPQGIPTWVGNTDRDYIDSDDSSELPWAPPEEDSDFSDDEPIAAPPESDDEG